MGQVKSVTRPSVDDICYNKTIKRYFTINTDFTNPNIKNYVTVDGNIEIFSEIELLKIIIVGYNQHLSTHNSLSYRDSIILHKFQSCIAPPSSL